MWNALCRLLLLGVPLLAFAALAAGRTPAALAWLGLALFFLLFALGSLHRPLRARRRGAPFFGAERWVLGVPVTLFSLWWLRGLYRVEPYLPSFSLVWTAVLASLLLLYGIGLLAWAALSGLRKRDRA